MIGDLVWSRARLGFWRSAGSVADRRVAMFLMALLVASLIVQIVEVFRLGINPDEFIFLANIYRSAND